MVVIENPKMTYIKVDGIQYGLVRFDRGDHFHLKVFKEGKLLGFKNLKFGVDTEYGTIAWAVRSVSRRVSNGLIKEKT